MSLHTAISTPVSKTKSSEARSKEPPAPSPAQGAAGLASVYANAKILFFDLIEPRRESVGVLRSHRGQGPEHDQIERALQQLHT